MKILKENYNSVTVEELRHILFEVNNQNMTVRELRQFLFNQDQYISAVKILFKAK